MMKKSVYFLFLAPFMTLYSCVQDEKSVFDDSSAVRLHARIEAYREMLAAAPNGWVMEYYPESHQAYGGINIWMKFNQDGTVDMTNETGYDGSEFRTESSFYDLLAETGPVLTFNTYNRYLHPFADPNPALTGHIDGLEGDYEFVIESAAAGKMELKGKKTQNAIAMTALDTNTSCQDYLSGVVRVAEASQAPAYRLYLGTDTIETRAEDRTFSFQWTEGQEVKTVKTGYIYTPAGIRLYRPLAVKGRTIREFTFDAATGTFQGADGTEASLVPVFPPVNREFAETRDKWCFDYPELSAALKTLWDQAEADCFAAEKEILQNVCIGYFALKEARETAIGFFTDKYQAVTSVSLLPAEGTDDRIFFERTGKDLLNYEYYMAYFDPFADAVVRGSPYQMTPNKTVPTAITFTSVVDPDITFTLFKP